MALEEEFNRGDLLFFEEDREIFRVLGEEVRGDEEARGDEVRGDEVRGDEVRGERGDDFEVAVSDVVESFVFCSEVSFDDFKSSLVDEGNVGIFVFRGDFTPEVFLLFVGEELVIALFVGEELVTALVIFLFEGTGDEATNTEEGLNFGREGEFVGDVVESPFSELSVTVSVSVVFVDVIFVVCLRVVKGEEEARLELSLGNAIDCIRFFEFCVTSFFVFASGA